MFTVRNCHACAGLMLLSLLSGCAEVHDPAVTAFQSKQRDSNQARPRDGNVYCMLGWTGRWSHGMEIIASRAKTDLKVHAVLLESTEWGQLAEDIRREHAAGHLSGPLVLVGHSLGADDQILVARRINQSGIPVDLLLLVDPNVPPHVPPNVRRCVNIFKSNDSVPFLSGTRVNPETTTGKVENIDLRFAPVRFQTSVITHFNIAQVTGVQEMVLAEIAKTCPLRQ